MEHVEIKHNIKDVWHGKRYYSLDSYLKNKYGRRIKKIAINAGFSCPNRDGTLDNRGCIFCSEGGSGDFAIPYSNLYPEKGYNRDLTGEDSYIAYFQAFTCTYGSPEQLEKLYDKALSDPLAAGISIATRPDCLSDEIIHVLSKLQKKYLSKFIWIELGLQTIHEKTAAYIRRGYSLECFSHAVHALATAHIPVVVHVILGLPGENSSMTVSTIQYLNTLPIFGIKLQLLHVLSGTDLAKDYEDSQFCVLEMEEYLNLLINCIEQLSPTVALHRITGDGPKNLLIAPLWSANKKKVLNTFHHLMKLQDSYQGKYWKGSISYESGTFNTL